MDLENKVVVVTGAALKIVDRLWGKDREPLVSFLRLTDSVPMPGLPACLRLL